MNTKNALGVSRLAVLVALCLLPSTSRAIDPKQPVAQLDQKEYFKPDLRITTSNIRVEPAALRAAGGRWASLAEQQGADLEVYLDPRSGAASSVMGHLPLIPGAGAGNEVTLADVSDRLGRTVRSVDSRAVGDLLRSFVTEHRQALGIDPGQLGGEKAEPVGDHLWQISIPQVVDGIPVRHGRLAATINHGNLVLLGTETWGNVQLDTTPSLTGEQALTLGFDYAGGRAPEDEMWQEPELVIIPYAPAEQQAGDAFVGTPGTGYAHRLAWAFGFVRPPELAAWEVLVDAHSGEVLAFEDTNHYASQQVVGGAYPLTSTGICPDNDTCGTMQLMSPMPFANTGLPAPNNFTNSAGLFDYTSGTVTTTLSGRYVRITDTCGAISISSPTGGMNLGGVNDQHDCIAGAAGNSPASRSAFYELNKLAELARGWLPANTWLQNQLTSNVNINQTCNAFWSPSAGTVNFYRSGGGCRNTGEIAAVFDHEWGHGMDDNDAAGALSSSSEAYADIAAIYRLQASCVGHGFRWTTNQGCGQTVDGTGMNSNESLTGTHCNLDCSGVRDCDWGKHADNTPDTPQNFSCPHCSSGPGPCGRQVHCSAAPSRQAAWDFVARDLQGIPFNYSETDAFIVGNKVFYQGSGNIGSWHACTCPSTSDGCGATNAYMQWLAADDDNGNLNDGTPHMTALFAAFNRHNIACATPTVTNSGCAGAPTEAPVLSAAIGSNSLQLSWTPVPGAVTYRVLRTEGHAGCDLGKAVIANVAGTGYTDPDVANDRPYSYVVQAVGGSSACYGPASACLTATPQPCAGSVGLNKTIYNCADTLAINLIDADLSGAGTHGVTVSSGSEPAGEAVTLVESPAGSGRFSGTFSTSSAAAATADGFISVAHGDTISVDYVDQSFCGTPNVNVVKTAPVDCAGPVISNVEAENVSGHAADISWNTNEPADSGLDYDTVRPPVAGNLSAAAPATSHFLHLTGLTECTNYYFAVDSTDAASNNSVATNGGEYFAFETGQDIIPSHVAVDVPRPVPDNLPAGATSIINVPVDGSVDQVVRDIDVTINISHTNNAHLDIFLIAPNGTRVELSTDNGSTSDNYVNTIFDDEAATPISAGTGPFTNRFRPEGSLATLDGIQGNGNWTLEVGDDTSGTTGTINSWTLTVTYTRNCGPHLKYMSHSIADDTCSGTGAGGANSFVDSGEQLTLPVVLRNSGTDDTTGISARITSTTPGVMVLTDQASYPDLPGGQSAGSTTAPFSVAVATGLSCGTLLEFTIDATANEGEWTDTFSVLLGEPDSDTLSNASPNVPRDIPDNNVTTSILTVSNTAEVLDVNVELTVTHELDEDLEIALIAPDGTRIELTSDNGGSGDNYISTVFDDEAATPITSGTAPFTGSFKPEALSGLTILDGMSANGTWTLEVRDDAINSLGKLVSWSLVLTTEAPPICEPCAVAAATTEVAGLSWTAGSTSSLEWAFAPDASFYNVYRGVAVDLPALLNAGVDSCFRDSTPALTTGGTLTEVPGGDGLFWYLVRGATTGGEGSAGIATSGPRSQDSTGVCP